MFLYPVDNSYKIIIKILTKNIEFMLVCWVLTLKYAIRQEIMYDWNQTTL